MPDTRLPVVSLPDDLIAALTDLRHALHRAPEISGQEERTAARIASELRDLGADQLWTGLGATVSPQRSTALGLVLPS